MSDIFISYKREDQEKARQLAGALQKQGWSVWWDPQLHGGERYDDVIQRVLSDARCCLVLLTPQALQSTYVMNEARYALRRSKLIPIVFEAVDLPFDLEGVHTQQLIDWEGDESSPAFNKLLDDIRAKLGKPTPQGKKLHHPVQSEIDTDANLDAEETRAREVAGEMAEAKKRPTSPEMPRKMADKPPGDQDSVDKNQHDSVQTEKPASAGRQASRGGKPAWRGKLLLGFAIAAVVAISVWLAFISSAPQPNGDKEITLLIRELKRTVREGELKKAETLLAKAAKLDPKNPTIEMLAKVLLEQTKERQEHIAMLLAQGRKAERERPLPATTVDYLVDHYREVLGLDPKNAEAQAGLERTVAYYLELAQKAISRNQSSEAMKNLRKAASINPDHPEVRQLLIELRRSE